MSLFVAASLVLLAVHQVSADTACHVHSGKCHLTVAGAVGGLGLTTPLGQCTLYPEDAHSDHSDHDHSDHDHSDHDHSDHMHRRMMAHDGEHDTTGYVCDAERAALGCVERTILHTMSAAMAHNMNVCMPPFVTAETAQQWWDAFDAAYVCNEEPTTNCDQLNVDAVMAGLNLGFVMEGEDAVRSYLSEAAAACSASSIEECEATVLPAADASIQLSQREGETTAGDGTAVEDPSMASMTAVSASVGLVALLGMLL